MPKKTATFDPGDGLPPFRQNVGLVLINPGGKIFSGKRRDQPDVHMGWQLPQGGVEQDEELHKAVLRELAEEVGEAVRADIITAYPEPLVYLFSDFMGARNIFDGKYRGQRQHWYYLRYHGDGSDIDIDRSCDGEPPEFTAWDWRSPHEILRDIVAVKKPIYEKILAYFERSVLPLIG